MDITTSSTMDNQNTYDYINGLLMNPTIFIVLVFVVLLYILLFSSLGNSNTSSNPGLGNMNEGTGSNLNIVVIIVIVVFGILTVINGIQYFFGISVVASISNLFSNSPEIDIGINQTTTDYSYGMNTPNVPELMTEKQVFNIPGNEYGYEDAKTLCTAYGAQLASYDQVEKSYANGGEWCNYGWSDGQMALFPTQKSTFNNLQTIPGHENDCGRPGINGGYMANPKLKFGVNCYGHKPKMTNEEEQNMETNSPYPKTEKDILLDKRVDYWKQHLDDILVSPFNYKSWNMI